MRYNNKCNQSRGKGIHKALFLIRYAPDRKSRLLISSYSQRVRQVFAKPPFAKIFVWMRGLCGFTEESEDF